MQRWMFGPQRRGRVARGTEKMEVLSVAGAVATDMHEPRTRVTCVGGDGTFTDITPPSPRGDDPQMETQGRRRDLRPPRGRSRADRTRLAEVMSRDIVCVAPDLETSWLLSLFTSLESTAFAVVDDGGRAIGMLTRSDLLYTWFRRGRPGSSDADLRETVADVMTCLAFTLSETATLSQAAALMAYEGVHRVPVVAPSGRVVGLVCALDLARWMAQHDGYLVPDTRPRRGFIDSQLGLAATVLGRSDAP